MAGPQAAKTEQFTQRLASIHAGQIRALSAYEGSKAPITVECKQGHKWTSRPEYLLQGYGCKQCADARKGQSLKLTHKEYTKRIATRFDGKIEVVGKYAIQTNPIKHRCIVHGIFMGTPGHMMNQNKYGCPDCAAEGKAAARTKSHKQVVAQIFAKHGNKVKLVDRYEGARTKHTFRCDQGHEWQAIPDAVIRLSGCPTCNEPNRFSKVAVKWIRKYCKRNNLGKAQHALNGGEACLYGASGRRYKVDGFLPQHNLVLEFHGDRFHGNPSVFASDEKPNPFSQMTARQLYKATRKREKDLRAAGYKVVSVWESDFKKGRLVSPVKTPAYLSAVSDQIMTWN